MIDQFPTPEITFLGEQDGPAARRLKDALATMLLQDITVDKAYLARVLYDGKTSGVILALKTRDEVDSEKLVAQAGKSFASIFNANAHLDIIFLSDAQNAEIIKVCPSFYDRKA
ncbi:SseB protein C-terminal domain-containing protein [Bradyrhizobium lablabi]|uniref:SseB protein C-terminal domain-containing protein n=1 Tax=Bradyrhizobium lablabi TaxID=722472 RepID=A0A1M6PCQ1_9BRAD|nr:enhanced serine sensitivity protein SseB C-terminal domain-containing protein [Bradyrhizobium lablabi]SHK05719.1 SseB protein C-terminal domain-containing protein [Bradyrhizobium lablabi]